MLSPSELQHEAPLSGRNRRLRTVGPGRTGRDATTVYAALGNGTVTLLAKGGQCT